MKVWYSPPNREALSVIVHRSVCRSVYRIAKSFSSLNVKQEILQQNILENAKKSQTEKH